MASIRAKLSYQRLKKLPLEITHEVQENHEAKRADQPPYQVAAESFSSSRRSSKSWLRLTGAGGRRWRRPRVRVAGLRRLLKRKVRLMRSAVRCSVAKVVRRLKEGRPYLGELFAGNYMFMQVSPSPTMGYVDKYSSFPPPPGFGHYQQQKLQCSCSTVASPPSHHRPPPTGSAFPGLLLDQTGPFLSSASYNN